MKQRMRVFELASELGVRLPVIIHIAEDLGLPVRRGVAQLTPRQETLIRDEFSRGTWKDQGQRRKDSREPSRPQDALRYAKCECCELTFTYGDSNGLERPRWCQDCADHYQTADETSERAIARYANHEQATRARWQYASQRATEYASRMKMAFESRQKWKAALVEIALGHELTNEGNCACGASESPCATIRMLEYANRGIARQVERLTSLSREELERELYADEPWRVDLRADDDPASGFNQPAA